MKRAMLGDVRRPGLTRLLGRGTAAELADLGRQRRRIALEHEQADLVEDRLHERSGSSGSRAARRMLSAGVGLGRS